MKILPISLWIPFSGRPAGPRVNGGAFGPVALPLNVRRLATIREQPVLSIISASPTQCKRRYVHARADGIVADHHQRDQRPAGHLPQGSRGEAVVPDPDRHLRSYEHRPLREGNPQAAAAYARLARKPG